MDCECPLDHRHISTPMFKKKKYIEWCAQCGQAENKGAGLRTCGRVVRVDYMHKASSNLWRFSVVSSGTAPKRRCQRKHWSVHKTLCDGDKSPYLRALGKNLSRCPNILQYLTTCAALALGLDKDDTADILGSDRTLSVCVNMIFVPCNTKDVKRLLQLGPEHFINAPVNGVLQFTDMVPVENAPKDMLHGGHLTQARFWDTLSTLADPKDYMMIDISLLNGPTNVGLSLPYRLGSLPEELQTMQFAHIDSSADIRVNVANSLQHLNDHLRADKDNVYDLRCVMRKCDKAPLVDAFLDMHATTWTPEQKKRVRDKVIGPDIPRLWGNLPSPRPSSRH